MNKTNILTLIQLEFLIVVLAAVIVGIVLFPIVYYNIHFPFFLDNAIFIFVGILLIKHIFLLKSSLINQYQKIKIALIPFSVILVVVLIRMLSGFITYIDEQIFADTMMHLPYDKQRSLSGYIHMEYMVFAVTAIVSAGLLPIRLLVSIWKEVNS